MRWEYDWFMIGSYPVESRDAVLRQTLADWGNQGWELVAVTYVQDRGVVYTFKRPLVDDGSPFPTANFGFPGSGPVGP